MGLQIPEDNIVLLWDHPGGHNKMKDRYKNINVVVGKHFGS